jgi:hypothetical protein
MASLQLGTDQINTALLSLGRTMRTGFNEQKEREGKLLAAVEAMTAIAERLTGPGRACVYQPLCSLCPFFYSPDCK